jgi:prephenate dehydratase
VTHTLDMFVESDLKIVAQIVLPVQHVLGNTRVPRSRSSLVPQSLGQCAAGFKPTCPKSKLLKRHQRPFR